METNYITNPVALWLIVTTATTIEEMRERLLKELLRQAELWHFSIDLGGRGNQDHTELESHIDQLRKLQEEMKK